MMLVCKLCGNDVGFVAIGTHGYNVRDDINSTGKFTDEGSSEDISFTVYTGLECPECDADTEDIEGAEEWLKQKSS